MTGMLNAASQAAYTDSTNTVWSYFQDADQPSTFYVTPRPAFAIANGIPQFHLTTYLDAQNKFVSALAQITTMLVVPDTVVQGVTRALVAKGVTGPAYQAMPFIDVATGAVDPNQAYLNFADTAGIVSRTAETMPSLSGSQTAVFTVDYLTESEAQMLTAYFAGKPSAGTVQVVYQLTVWARLGGVTAQVKFDAQAAYEYQRTYKWVR